MKKPARQNESAAARGPKRNPQGDAPKRAATPGTPSSFRRLFSIDPRSLALFRVAVGALLLAELAIRATDLNAMYTDDGMFSRAEICRRATNIWNWSFHFGGGSAGYQSMLFGIAGILGIALLVGFQTRLATIGSWLMLISIQHRVPPILSGAEILLRMLLFWAMFLPLQQAWSLDRWIERTRAGSPPHARRTPVFNVGTTAILIQMGLMYLCSAIFKSNSEWFRGDAIAGSLAHAFYASPAAAYLLRFPALLPVLTWATFALEWAAPLALFFPKATARVRLATVAALAAMHAGIGICLEVGFFSHVALAGLTLFLPSEFWNSRPLARLAREPAHTPPLASGTERPKPHSWCFLVAQGVCLIALIYVLAVNFNGLPGHPLAPLAPERWKPVTTTFGLGQRWGMFEAVPSRDGWYVARARLADGSEVDLLRHGAPVDWKRPECPARLYPNHFWQKVFREMAYDDEQGFQLFRAPVADFLCREWNARNPPERRIHDFEFIYCMAATRNGGVQAAPPIAHEQLVHLDFNQN